MHNLKNSFITVLATGIWINISETIRWELIIKSLWIEHYENLGLDFPVELGNNLIWMTWGFLVAFVIFTLSKKFSILQTTIITWLALFVMLWIVLGNINILPMDIIKYVVPLSLLEVFVASWICKKLYK